MARQRLGIALRENTKMKKQVHDLSKQVTVLIKEVEAARFGGSMSLEEMEAEAARHEAGSSDADSIISQRLVVFRSVILSS